jgi:hypothetical protein
MKMTMSLLARLEGQVYKYGSLLPKAVASCCVEHVGGVNYPKNLQSESTDLSYMNLYCSGR